LQASAGNAISSNVTIEAGNIRPGAAGQIADTSVLTLIWL
jgi:hypothetical protein